MSYLVNIVEVQSGLTTIIGENLILTTIVFVPKNQTLSLNNDFQIPTMLPNAAPWWASTHSAEDLKLTRFWIAARLE